MSMKPIIINYLRFSTPEQEKGDSARRQTQRAEEYSRDKGEESTEALRLEDRGLSAYYGHHRTKGDLGKLLKWVEEGRVPRGTELRVEGFDRLSREQVLDAFHCFTSIIRAGIKVVTLMDNMEYTEESINDNPTQLMLSLTHMHLAHMESKRKSDNLSKAWDEKRKEAQKSKKRLSKKCPSWLEPQESGDSFDRIPERCKVIEQVFKMYVAGTGKESIARKLNQGNGWKPNNGWSKSYIDKILRNRAVIGEYQPHCWEEVNSERKRVPVGDPIKDYHPRLISDELFYQVQERLDRNISFGGKTGKVNNLFSHIAKCGYCGGSMRFVNKGKPPKGGRRLICDNAVRGRGCIRLPINYEDFEKLILTYCKGLNVHDLLPDSEVETELNQLQTELSAVKGEFGHIAAKIENVTDSITITESRQVREHLEKKLNELLEQQGGLEHQKNNIEDAIDKLSKAEKTFQEQLQSINELWDFMQSAPEKELIVVRSRLRDKLRRLIRRIRVFPVDLPIIAPAKAKRFMDKARKIKRLTYEQRLMVELIKESQRVEIEFEREGFRFLFPSSRTITVDIPVRESYNTKSEDWLCKEVGGKILIKRMRG